MAQVSVREAKVHRSRLLDRAAAGEEIVIARAGKPVAGLVALRSARRPRRLGAFRGRIRIAADFDVLPEDIRRVFEGEVP